MSCTVTVKDIRSEIEKEINVSFPTAQRTSYEDRLSLFVPYDAMNPNKNVLYGKMKSLETKYNKDYNSNLYDNIVSFNQVRGGVEFNVHPSIKLAQSMTEQNKIDDTPTFESIRQEYLYQGEIYPSEEDMRAAMQEFSYMPTNIDAYNPTNYNDYIAHKEALLKKVNVRLGNAVDTRRHNKNSDIRVEVNTLNNLKETLEREINDLINAPDIFEKTLSVFNSDLALIDKLLDVPMPTVENIQYAEDMIAYFSTISDYSMNNLKGNRFVQAGDSSQIEPDVLEVLHKLNNDLGDKRTKVYDAKMQYLLQAIGESENLKSIFPDDQLEEIRDKLLATKSDIGIASMLFATVDKEFGGQDSLLAQLIRLELEETRDRVKPQAIKFIQEINELQGRVVTKLLGMGYGVSNYNVLNKLASEVSYNIFYQKNDRGNKRGKLVNKYSEKWFSDLGSFIRTNQEKINEAWKANDKTTAPAINKALVEKYNWINDRADFVEIDKLPEIISNPDFALFDNHFKPTESIVYKNELISRIGQYNYNKLIDAQKESIEDFMLALSNEKAKKMDDYGVTDFNSLPEGEKNFYSIYEKRNNPFKFLDSHRSGQEGRIDHMIGQTGEQYQSHLKYNSYIPKEQVKRYDITGEELTSDSGYYDSNFKKIEADSDLLKFWEVLADSAQYINSALSDSKESLSHNSLLRMSKSMMDVMLDRNTGVLNKGMTLLSETGATLKNMVSSKLTDVKANDVTEVNKGGIETINAERNKRYDIFRMKFNRLSRLDLSNKTNIDPHILSLEAQQLLADLTGLEMRQIKNQFGEKVNIASMAREFITNQIMDEQTFNLPVMMRAYLDVVSEYKAQKESLPKINIYKNIYDTIQLEKAEVKSGIVNDVKDVAQRIFLKQRELGIQDTRVRGQIRTQAWINQNVKGLIDKDYWGKMGKALNKGEKEAKKEGEAYLEYLNKKLTTTTDDDKKAEVLTEISEVQNRLLNLGKNYTWGAIYNTFINRMGIFLGLGFNIPSQFFNRYQGWHQLMINDTGRYWTAGNGYAANAFVNRKGIRYIPGMHSYRNEVRKVKLLTEKMGYIQDNTNELDRARRQSGLTGWTRKLNPFFLTEYVEWHNQVPNALAILQDHYIPSAKLDSEGKPESAVPVFDGKSQSFPAYNIVEGELVLKSEYRTETNIATWENFNSREYTDVKGRISSTIALLNGDYSKTGTTYIKNYTLGKTLMMFKTWMANQYFLRFAKNQTSVALGLKDFDGSYAGALSNSKTTVAGTTGLTLAIGATSFMAAGLGLGALTVTGLATYNYFQLKNNKNIDGESIEAMNQLTAAGQAIIKKAIGLPINTLSGRDIIKAHTFNELNITDQERQNLSFIINELVGLLWLTLGKVLIKSLMHDDDEDEPKTLNGKTKNPYYKGGEKPDESTYNILENSITRTINDATLFTNAQGLYEAVAKPAGIDSWFSRVTDLNDGLKRKLITNDDILQTGPNAGESKLGNAVSKMTIPNIFNEWAEGDFTSFGFSKYKEKEWVAGEPIDGLFQSDYKQALKEAKAERVQEKVKLEDYWKSEYDYDNQDPQVQEILSKRIKKQVKQELDAKYPLKIRANFDENQNEIE